MLGGEVVLGVRNLIDENASTGITERVGSSFVGTVGDEVVGVVRGGVTAVALVVFGKAKPGDGFGGVRVGKQWSVRTGVVEDVVVGCWTPWQGRQTVMRLLMWSSPP
jgi:hypothetical protein